MRITFVMYNVLSTERMSIMLLSALAKQHFPHAETSIAVYTESRFKEKIEAFKPDIVAFSAMTGEHIYYLTIAKEVKEIARKLGKNIFCIMGGQHCTFAPEILQGSALDAIGVGECDGAWPELLGALERGQNINEISNIVTQENFSRVVKPATFKTESYIRFQATNIRARTCKDPINHKNCLDHLPFLDWNLFLTQTGFEKMNSIRKRTIMTRRGCPFKCTYCFNRVFNAVHAGEKTVHNYSVDRVIAECEYVGKHWPTEFWKIYDDVFTFGSKGKEGERLQEFAEKWPSTIDLPFFILTRSDLVAHDPKILHLLKQAGCASLTMSIEGGNEHIRNKILERPMPNEDIISSHRLAWDLGIYTFSNVIFSVPVKKEEVAENNLPLHSIDRDIESVRLAMESRVHFLECPQFFPYIGTKLGKYCEEQEFFDGDYDKLPQSYQNLSPLDCFTLYEKRMSQNLALLAMWCVYLGSRKNFLVREYIAPFFFKLTTKILIRMPWIWCTKIYFLMYSVLQQWLCAAEIYRPKYLSPVKVIRKGFFSRLKYEFIKQFPKK
jgi:anaerobic magnesium-protoporphyrin IX monomethyl ester cyclase